MMSYLLLSQFGMRWKREWQLRGKGLFLIARFQMNAFKRSFAAIQSKDDPYDIWGFLDGSVIPVRRPQRHQRLKHRGHKRIHCMQCHGVMTPYCLTKIIFACRGTA